MGLTTKRHQQTQTEGQKEAAFQNLFIIVIIKNAGDVGPHSTIPAQLPKRTKLHHKTVFLVMCSALMHSTENHICIRLKMIRVQFSCL